MGFQNATSQDSVKLSLEEHHPVLLTICVASLILGLPMAYNALDHLKERPTEYLQDHVYINISAFQKTGIMCVVIFYLFTYRSHLMQRGAGSSGYFYFNRDSISSA